MVETMLMQVKYGFPARGMKVIGVTGTDGKTSTSLLIHAMLTDAGYKVGLLTTAATGVRKLEVNETHMTVTKASVLLSRIKKMRAEQPEYLILEITSHALAQNRAWGIKYDMAVMTNMSPEHLDYHGTFERYRDAKVKLFRQTNSNRAGRRIGIINADDATAPYFARAVDRTLTYGIDSGDLKAAQIKSDALGNTFSLNGVDRKLKITTHLPARFNVYNASAAAAVGIELGLADEQIEKGIASLQAVPGRMNTVETGTDFNVVIDFAHTPAAFTNVFSELRPLTKGKLIAVFGATGDRDKTKRPKMAEVAVDLCDAIVLTEDDDNTENGEAILATLKDAAIAAGGVLDKNIWAIHDRRSAFKQAVSVAKKGDTIVLLGIGHQTTLSTNAGEIPWSEAAVIKEVIAESK